MDQRIQKIIQWAIETIKTEQGEDGGFFSLSSSDQKHFSGKFRYQTTFFSSNILCCLNSVRRYSLESSTLTDLETVCEKTANFLLAERSNYWSFNYWARSTEEYRTMPYPDDLDDTFVALIGLYEYDPNIIDGGVSAKIAKLLPLMETNPGGPYRTWIVSPDTGPEWHDVDMVVNSNIGYFLSRLNVSLPNLAKFIEKCVRDENIYSRYYPGFI